MLSIHVDLHLLYVLLTRLEKAKGNPLALDWSVRGQLPLLPPFLGVPGVPIAMTDCFVSLYK